MGRGRVGRVAPRQAQGYLVRANKVKTGASALENGRDGENSPRRPADMSTRDARASRVPAVRGACAGGGGQPRQQKILDNCTMSTCNVCTSPTAQRVQSEQCSARQLL